MVLVPRSDHGRGVHVVAATSTAGAVGTHAEPAAPLLPRGTTGDLNPTAPEFTSGALWPSPEARSAKTTQLQEAENIRLQRTAEAHARASQVHHTWHGAPARHGAQAPHDETHDHIRRGREGTSTRDHQTQQTSGRSPQVLVAAPKRLPLSPTNDTRVAGPQTRRSLRPEVGVIGGAAGTPPSTGSTSGRSGVVNMEDPSPSTSSLFSSRPFAEMHPALPGAVEDHESRPRDRTASSMSSDPSSTLLGSISPVAVAEGLQFGSPHDQPSSSSGRVMKEPQKKCTSAPSLSFSNVSSTGKQQQQQGRSSMVSSTISLPVGRVVDDVAAQKKRSGKQRRKKPTGDDATPCPKDPPRCRNTVVQFADKDVGGSEKSTLHQYPKESAAGPRAGEPIKEPMPSRRIDGAEVVALAAPVANTAKEDSPAKTQKRKNKAGTPKAKGRGAQDQAIVAAGNRIPAAGNPRLPSLANILRLPRPPNVSNILRFGRRAAWHAGTVTAALACQLAQQTGAATVGLATHVRHKAVNMVQRRREAINFSPSRRCAKRLWTKIRDAGGVLRSLFRDLFQLRGTYREQDLTRHQRRQQAESKKKAKRERPQEQGRQQQRTPTEQRQQRRAPAVAGIDIVPDRYAYLPRLTYHVMQFFLSVVALKVLMAHDAEHSAAIPISREERAAVKCRQEQAAYLDLIAEETACFFAVRGAGCSLLTILISPFR